MLGSQADLRSKAGPDDCAIVLRCLNNICWQLVGHVLVCVFFLPNDNDHILPCKQGGQVHGWPSDTLRL